VASGPDRGEDRSGLRANHPSGGCATVKRQSGLCNFCSTFAKCAATLLSNQTIQVRNTPGGTFKPGPFGANTAVPRTSQNVVPSSLQVDGGVAFVVREDELSSICTPINQKSIS
jgi:hypothetical protein